MDYPVSTHRVEREAIVSIRGRYPPDDLPAILKATIRELLARLRLLGVSPSGPPFVIYREFGADGIDAEVSVPTRTPVAASGRITSRILPAMTVARTLHVGPYGKLGNAYAAVSTWIADHGAQAVGPVHERYLIGPGDGVASTDYRTEVEMPIVPVVVAAPV